MTIIYFFIGIKIQINLKFQKPTLFGALKIFLYLKKKEKQKAILKAFKRNTNIIVNKFTHTGFSSFGV